MILTWKGDAAVILCDTRRGSTEEGHPENGLLAETGSSPGGDGKGQRGKNLLKYDPWF